MKIVIITDGNGTQGLGHIYQSKTLAKYLLEREEHHPEITFLTKSNEEVATLIRDDGFNVKRLNNDDEIFNFLQMTHPKVVIFDKIDVSPSLAQRIKSELHLKLVIFTNLTTANEIADISVMGTMGSNFKNLVLTRGNTLEFWGPKYIILRPDFLSFQKKEIHEIHNILLIFGGADPANLTLSVLEMLLKSARNYTIKVILGVANKRKEKIDALLKTENGMNVKVFDNVLNTADLMYHSDLVLVSPGISFFEALVSGTPVICFHQNEFQRDAWKEDIKTHDKKDVMMLIEMIDNREFILPEMSFIKSMKIGQGIDEIISVIIK